MKTIRNTIIDKGQNVLNVYFTAGHPTLDSVVPLIVGLANHDVDLIELGMPYSDPLADGPTIQNSSALALKNGQTIGNIFKQVKEARKTTEIPIILMGYFNQMLQYGVEKFLEDSSTAGIQGLIIPDMPMDIYERDYLPMFQKYSMEISFLITPMTSIERIHQADRLSSGFLYVVSQSSITGKQGGFDEKQIQYFKRIHAMDLKSPRLIGFGIHDKETRDIADNYGQGSIVGSAFIRQLDQNLPLEASVEQFMTKINA
jgi:tryptophan synthase alpha chain